MKTKIIISAILLIIAIIGNADAQIQSNSKNGSIFVDTRARNYSKRISTQIQLIPTGSGCFMNIGIGNGLFHIRRKVDLVKKPQDTVRPKNNIFYEGKNREY